MFYVTGDSARKNVFLYCPGLTSGESALEDDEQIETQIVTREGAMAMVLDGRISDAKTIVGLLLYAQLSIS